MPAHHPLSSSRRAKVANTTGGKKEPCDNVFEIAEKMLHVGAFLFPQEIFPSPKLQRPETDPD